MLQLGNVISNASNVDPKFNNELLSHYGIPSVNSVVGYDKSKLSDAISSFVEKYKKYATLPNIELLNDSS
jgi:predicted component of type VI protein secretion system